MVICKVVIGHTPTPIFGVYLPPSMLEHLPYFKESLQFLKGMDQIFLGESNMDLDKAHRSRSQSMADLLTEFDVIDLVWNFQHRHCFRDQKTWK